jgi:hypothetical protein
MVVCASPVFASASKVKRFQFLLLLKMHQPSRMDSGSANPKVSSSLAIGAVFIVLAFFANTLQSVFGKFV